MSYKEDLYQLFGCFGVCLMIAAFVATIKLCIVIWRW